MPYHKRFFIVLCEVFLSLLVVLLFTSNTFASQTRALFGPEVFTRTSGATDVYTRSFTVPNYISVPYNLHIRNGNPGSSTNKVAVEDAVSSASVWINGVKVVAENEFSKTVDSIDKTITLNPTNTLEIRLNSAPGSYITATISGVINLGSLNQPRSGHTANTVSDGRVLITGGNSVAGILSSAELFYPSTLSFSILSSGLTTSRAEHTANLVPDNSTLLIAGKDPLGTIFTAELFDLTSGTFTQVNNILKNLRSGHTSTLLPDGRILIAGGVDASNIPLAEAETFDPRSALIFDPMTGSFNTLPNSLSTARADHTATLLPDGRVLIIGGKNDSGVLSSIEVFNPVTQVFTLLSAVLNTPRYGHTAIFLPDGRILITGGSDGTSILSSVEIYDPNANTFTVSSNILTAPRFNHTATLLNNGEILITGGENQSGIMASAEFFGPPAKDTANPTVLFTDPSSGANDVNPNTIISVSFSEPVDVTTVSASTLTLTGPAGNVSGKVSAGESGLLAFFIPDVPLTPGTTYTINLSGIKDTSGNPLTSYTSVFTTTAAPAITGFSPTSGAVGTIVTITGTNFDATAAVLFNGMQATVSSATATTIIATVPHGAATGPITVTTAGGTAVSSANFTVINSPIITGFTPTKGAVGAVVFINGKNFDPSNTRVKFNGKDAVITAITSTTISTTVPSGATTGLITITTVNGTTQSQYVFTIIPRNDFSVSAGPQTSTAAIGRSASFSISIKSTGTETFTGLVGFTVAGLPAGASASFKPQYATVNNSSALTITTSGSTTAGSYNLTVTGSANIEGVVVNRTANITLTVLPSGATTLSGRILSSKDARPVQNVTVRLGGLSVVTDASGYFIFMSPPAGNQIIAIDGHTGNTANATYPSDIPVPVAITQGQPNDLPYPIYLHEVNTKTYTDITQNQMQDIKVTDPAIPNFEMTIPKGVQIIGHDGQPNQRVSVTTLPLDQIPIKNIPEGIYTKTLYMFYFFKPGGGTPTKPIPITYPNDLGAEPGQRIDLWYYNESLIYNPNSNQWKIYGQGTVTQDGRQITPDPGVGMPKFCCGATFVSTSNPAGNPSSPPDSCPTGIADPVDPNTGAFKYNFADLSIAAPFSVAIQRFYNSQNTNIGPFGRGTSIGYNHFLRVSVDSLVYTPPEGGSYIFSKNADGTYTNSAYPFLSGVKGYVNPDNTRTLRFKDGLTYTFDANGMLIEKKDRNGNKATIARDSSGNITGVTDSFGRVISIGYATLNIGGFTFATLITSITDFTNRVVTYSYGASGRLSAVTNPEGGVTTYSYDGYGRLASIINPKGITEATNEYDSSGRVVKQTHADGGVYNISYTAAGGTVTETRLTDPNGNITTYRFNGSRYSTELTDSMGQQNTYTRAVGTNKILSVTDPLGRTTAYTYDTNGNTTAVTDAAGNVTLYEYEPIYNKPTKITDALGNVTTMSYDTKGNLTGLLTPDSKLTTITYNTNGQPVSVTDALSNITTFEYDNYGNLVKTTDPLANSATMQYDMLGRLLKATNPEGKNILYSYDNLNRITEITDALNGITRFAYDQNGNLLTVTDAKNQTITYTHNNRNKLASMIDQLGRTETYSYDLNDNLISVTDRKNQATTYTYDAMNRVARTTYADASTIDYTYDAAGRMTYINDSVSGPIEYIYGNTGCAVCGGALDKVVQEITPLGSISYTYDAIGRRTSMTVAGQTAVNYGYDVNSHLISVVGAGLVPAQIAYDAIGRRASLTLPNGVTTNYNYDNASRILNLEHLNPLNQILEKIDYGYDANGSRTSMNRLNVTPQLPNPATNITYNTANQMLSFNDKNISYDENGNITAITNSCGITTYTWDARNRLVGINGFDALCAPLSAQFKYDDLGRRIGKTINGKMMIYLYDDIDIVQEIENGQVTVNYIRTLKIDEPVALINQDGIYYYIYDGLGSVIGLADQTGNEVVQYHYDPFGNTTSNNPSFKNSFQYAGRENDGTGHLYERERYYNFELQRYISEDPIGLAGGDVNYFVRVGNNPLNWIDSLGLDMEGTAIGGSIGGVVGTIIGGIIGGSGGGIICSPSGAGAIVCGEIGAAEGAAIGGGIGTITGAAIGDVVGDMCLAKGHRKKRPSTHDKHTKPRPGDPEKGDQYRRPPKQRPDNWKGPWPPKSNN